MEFWFIWGVISKVMAVLCLVTALAAAVAAGILLIREKLIARLSGEWAQKSGRRTMILTAVAALIWILVIGKSAYAAEMPMGYGRGDRMPREGTKEESATESATGPIRMEGEPSVETEHAAPVEPGSDGGPIESGESSGSGKTTESGKSSGSGKTTENGETAAEGETSGSGESAAEGETSGGGETAGQGQTTGGGEPANLDLQAPVISIEMDASAGRDSEGVVYCRGDNAGIRVRIAEGREFDSGISSYQVCVSDPEGNEIHREGVSAGNEVLVILDAEEVASLEDGIIQVEAEAADEAGNQESVTYSFVLDRTPPVGEIRIRSKAKGYLYEEEKRPAGYFGGDVSAALYVKDYCGNQEIPMDADAFTLCMQFAKEEDAEGSTAREQQEQNDYAHEQPEQNDFVHVRSERKIHVREDGTAIWSAYGKDRAGNPLSVKVVYETGIHVPESGSADHAEGLVKPSYSTAVVATGQSNEMASTPVVKTVRDTVSPLLTAALSRPIGHPAGEDEPNQILYYGNYPAYYPDGKPSIHIEYIVEDLNLDEDGITFYKAFEPVPEHTCCEDVRPKWKKDRSLSCKSLESIGNKQADSGEGIQSDPAEKEAPDPAGNKQIPAIYAACTLLLGGNGVADIGSGTGGDNHQGGGISEVFEIPDGVYRFGIEGRDKAGNPLVMQDEKKQDALYGFVCTDQKKGRYETGRKVVDTEAPSGRITIDDGNGTTYCRLTQHGAKWVTEREGFMPYRRE